MGEVSNMDRFNFSAKHLAINKANTQIVIAVGAASFITVFCLVAAKAVLSQYQYQSRVIAVVKTADNQLQTNITTYGSLVKSYSKFNAANPNAIGGTVTGSSNDNTQIVLDALPGAYDFPALATTLQYILTVNGMQQGGGASGTDSPPAATTSAGTNPQALSIPFGLSVTSVSYASAQSLLQYLQQSIRPIAVDSISLAGDQGDLTLSVAAHTFYQPAKTLSITKETVK
jgi:hypothetical protein